MLDEGVKQVCSKWPLVRIAFARLVENFPKGISKLLNRSHMQIFFQGWSGKNSVISKITPAEWCSK
jgi:hypothetical protein